MQSKKAYSRFQIPPDFKIAQLHRQACYSYDIADSEISQCPCCNKYVGQKRMGLCSSLKSIRKLGQQIPMFFYFMRLLSIIMFITVFIEAGIYLFYPFDFQYMSFELPEMITSAKIHAGYTQSSQSLIFVRMIIFSIIILFLKINMKRRKYLLKKTDCSISKQTLILINLHKKATQQQVRTIFALEAVPVRDVVFTYRVTDYLQCLEKLPKLNCQLALQQVTKKSTKQIDQTLKAIDKQKEKMIRLKRQIMQNNNRTSVAFAIFNSIQDKEKSKATLKVGFFKKLLLKLCPSFSKTQINNQHFSVHDAPDPEDVQWGNLQHPYLRTKVRTWLSNLASFVVLVIGLLFYFFISEISSTTQTISGLILYLIKTLSVFVCNFLLVTFIEWTSRNIQKYQTRTQRYRSQINKMTFFLFVNISLAPLIDFIRLTINNQEGQRDQFVGEFIFSVVTISILNITKPIIILFSVERVIKWISQKIQLYKGQKCMLTQNQANILFEPIQYPIQQFYSMILSSLMMCFFYLSIIQTLIVYQLISILFFYFVAKWMLVRVCREPIGISLKLSNLAQSLLRTIVPIYWVGKVIIYYFLQEYYRDQYSFFGYIFWKNGDPFVILSWLLCIFMLCSQFLVKIIAKRCLCYKEGGDYSFIMQRDTIRRGYREANLFQQLKNDKRYANNY